MLQVIQRIVTFLQEDQYALGNGNSLLQQQFLSYDHCNKMSEYYNSEGTFAVLKELPTQQKFNNSNHIPDSHEILMPREWQDKKTTFELTTEKVSPEPLNRVVSSLLGGGNWRPSQHSIQEKYHLWSLRFQCRAHKW